MMKIDSEPAAILVAEDDPNDRALLEQTLRDAGWKNPIIAFGNGAEVIDFLRKSCFTNPGFDLSGAWLLFLDLHIPQVDGCGVIAWIRRHSLSGVRIVALAEPSKSEEMKRATALGADRLLLKPPSDAVLREELENLARLSAAS